MSAASARTDRLELDIDLRLAPLWREVIEAEIDQTTIDLLGPYMRAAYGAGYCEALNEDAAGHRGQLCVDHGYRPPARSSQLPREERWT